MIKKVQASNQLKSRKLLKSLKNKWQKVQWVSIRLRNLKRTKCLRPRLLGKINSNQLSKKKKQNNLNLCWRNLNSLYLTIVVKNFYSMDSPNKKSRTLRLLVRSKELMLWIYWKLIPTIYSRLFQSWKSFSKIGKRWT